MMTKLILLSFFLSFSCLFFLSSWRVSFSFVSSLCIVLCLSIFPSLPLFFDTGINPCLELQMMQSNDRLCFKLPSNFQVSLHYLSYINEEIVTSRRTFNKIREQTTREEEQLKSMTMMKVCSSCFNSRLVIYFRGREKRRWRRMQQMLHCIFLLNLFIINGQWNLFHFLPSVAALSPSLSMLVSQTVPLFPSFSLQFHWAFQFLLL